jgi:hypothetical protein
VTDDRVRPGHLRHCHQLTGQLTGEVRCDSLLGSLSLLMSRFSKQVPVTDRPTKMQESSALQLPRLVCTRHSPPRRSDRVHHQAKPLPLARSGVTH